MYSLLILEETIIGGIFDSNENTHKINDGLGRNSSNNIMKSGKHLIGSTVAYLQIFLI